MTEKKSRGDTAQSASEGMAHVKAAAAQKRGCIPRLDRPRLADPDRRQTGAGAAGGKAMHTVAIHHEVDGGEYTVCLQCRGL